MWWVALQLKSNNIETRLQAVARLADSESPRALKVLIEAFNSEEPRVTLAVATAIGKLGNDKAIAFLIKSVQSAKTELRQIAVDALRYPQPDPRITDAMVAALRDPDAGVRGRASRLLERQHWRPANVKEQLWFAIGRGQLDEAAAFGPEAIEPLEMVLKGGAYNIQVAALHALGEIADERVLNSLIPALQSADYPVCIAAIEALSSFGGSKAAEAIAPTLKHADHRVRVAAIEGAVKLETKQCLEALSELLKDPMWDVRRTAAQALGKIKNPEAVPGLVALLNDPDPDVRETAITSLGQLHDSRAVGPLVLALVDRESSVRRMAAVTLPQIDSRWALSNEARRMVPELRAAMSADDSAIRFAAANVLKQFGETAAHAGGIEQANLLIASGHKQRRVFTIFLELISDLDRDVRLAAAEALGRLGDKRAASALMTALSDKDGAVKRAVGQSLAVLGPS